LIENTATKEIERVECDALILQLGFVSSWGDRDVGLPMHGRKQSRSRRTRSRDVDAQRLRCGADIAWYDGMITLSSLAASARRPSRPTLRGPRAAA
jgi:hypothetical protein